MGVWKYWTTTALIFASALTFAFAPSSAVAEGEPLATPVIKTTQNQTGRFELTWEPVEGAKSYKVYYREPGVDMDLWRLVGGDKTSYKHYGAKETTYELWVVAIADPASGFVDSEPSERASVAYDPNDQTLYERVDGAWTPFVDPASEFFIASVQNKSSYFTLTWEPFEGATSYKIWYQESGNALTLWRSSTKTTYNHYGAVSGKNFVVWVAAMKGDQELAATPKVEFKFDPNDQTLRELVYENGELKLEPLASPTWKTKQNKDSYFELTWEPVEGAKSYKVYYREPGVDAELWRLVTGGKTTYKHYGALEKTYEVWVVAVAEPFSWRADSEPSETISVAYNPDDQTLGEWRDGGWEYKAEEEPEPEPLATPTLKTKQNKNAYFELTWEPVEGAKSYKVWYREPGVEIDLWRLVSGGKTTYKHYGALKKTYEVWVVAIADSDSGRADSAPSETVTVEYDPADQTLYELDARDVVAMTINAERDATNPETIDVSWDAVDGAYFYEVYVTVGDLEEGETGAFPPYETTELSLALDLGRGSFEIGVVAWGDGGIVGMSEDVYVPAYEEKPPVRLLTMQNKSDCFEITWEPFEGATSYKVWIREPGAGDYWRSTTSASYEHYDALAMKYSVWVVALKDGEEISEPSAIVVVDFAAGKQDKPIDISGLNPVDPLPPEPETFWLEAQRRNDSPETIGLTWDCVDGAEDAESYDVYLNGELVETEKGCSRTDDGSFWIWTAEVECADACELQVVATLESGATVESEIVEVEAYVAPEPTEWKIQSAWVDEDGMLRLDIDPVKGALYYYICCGAGHDEEEWGYVVVGGFDAVDMIDSTADCWVCETTAPSIYVVAFDENFCELARTPVYNLSGGNDDVPNDDNTEDDVPNDDNTEDDVPNDDNTEDDVPNDDNTEDDVPNDDNTEDDVPNDDNTEDDVPNDDNAEDDAPNDVEANVIAPLISVDETPGGVEVQLLWADVEGADRYVVYLRDESDGSIIRTGVRGIFAVNNRIEACSGVFSVLSSDRAYTFWVVPEPVPEGLDLSKYQGTFCDPRSDENEPANECAIVGAWQERNTGNWIIRYALPEDASYGELYCALDDALICALYGDGYGCPVNLAGLGVLIEHHNCDLPFPDYFALYVVAYDKNGDELATSEVVSNLRPSGLD